VTCSRSTTPRPTAVHQEPHRSTGARDDRITYLSVGAIPATSPVDGQPHGNIDFETFSAWWRGGRGRKPPEFPRHPRPPRDPVTTPPLGRQPAHPDVPMSLTSTVHHWPASGRSRTGAMSCCSTTTTSTPPRDEMPASPDARHRRPRGAVADPGESGRFRRDAPPGRHTAPTPGPASGRATRVLQPGHERPVARRPRRRGPGPLRGPPGELANRPSPPGCIMGACRSHERTAFRPPSPPTVGPATPSLVERRPRRGRRLAAVGARCWSASSAGGLGPLGVMPRRGTRSATQRRGPDRRRRRPGVRPDSVTWRVTPTRRCWWRA